LSVGRVPGRTTIESRVVQKLNKRLEKITNLCHLNKINHFYIVVICVKERLV